MPEYTAASPAQDHCHQGDFFTEQLRVSIFGSAVLHYAGRANDLRRVQVARTIIETRTKR